MKYQAKNYARAFTELGSKPEQIKKLFAVMKKNGDLLQAHIVVKEIEKIEVKKNNGHMIEVEFARAQGALAREKMLSQFGKYDRVVTKIRQDLIAGARMITDGEYELDMSLAGRLEKLFT